jgi:hypothetical protein
MLYLCYIRIVFKYSIFEYKIYNILINKNICKIKWKKLFIGRQEFWG